MAEWTIAFAWKAKGRRLAARRFESSRIRHFMFDWLKQLFSKKQETDEVTVHFVLPNGKKFDIVAINAQMDKDASCPIHKDYTGMTAPTNNCNICWEIYSKKLKSLR